MTYFPYFYGITIARVLDGDTVEAVFDLGFFVSLKVTVRLAGYDAPETFRPKTEVERLAGIETKTHLQSLLNMYGEGELFCRSTKIDLYGRSTGILYYKSISGDYISINDLMAQWIQDVHYTKEELRS